MGHVLMENRHGLVVDGDLTGTAEREPNARAHSGLRSVHKLYDTKGFVAVRHQGDPACGTE